MTPPGGSGSGPGPRTDLAFVNGRVATMSSAAPFTDALATAGGRILALGEQAVRERVATGTEVVDLGGRFLAPGFHDAHAHPLHGGIERLRCDLNDSADPDECLRRVADHARRRGPTDAWVLGGGWEMGLFPGGTPERSALDAVTGDRPAYLLNRDHHAAWVNSAALRRAGLDRTVPDPPGGRIERDETGEPAGTLHERAADLVADLLPSTPDAEARAGLLEGQRYLRSCGVTTWHDAILGDYLGHTDPLPLYRDLAAEGALTGTVRGALWWDPDRDEAQIEQLRARASSTEDGRFRTNTVKIMVDGVCESRTASMLRPYLGGHDHGISFVDGSALVRAVRALDAAGFQVHFHAVGDRAVRDALDAVAAARASNGHNDLRHQIAHAQIVAHEDLPRFAELGVAVNMQAAWAVNDVDMTDLTTPLLGAERAGRQYPFRSLRDTGAVLAAGSDWPVSDADPMLAAHVAVNRREPGTDQPAFRPEQGLSFAEMLTAYTSGSAWVDHLETNKGSLEVGKDADLVVLDRDPFRVPPEEIGHVRVDLTFCHGRLVHERNAR